MELGVCLVSSDLNRDYLDFWPSVHETWTKVVGLKCKLILVGDHVPDDLPWREDIIQCKPLEGLPIPYQTQCIRLLYPSLLKTEGKAVIISDIDLIPLNKSYYVDSAKTSANDTQFLVYRSKILDEHKQIPMCFCAATPSVWGQMFKVKRLSDVEKRLRKWATIDPRPYVSDAARTQGCKLWCCDQYLLYERVKKRTEADAKSVCNLVDATTKFQRICRSSHSYENPDANTLSRISKGEFSDAHLPRPYKRHKTDIDKLVHAAVNPPSPSAKPPPAPPAPSAPPAVQDATPPPPMPTPPKPDTAPAPPPTPPKPTATPIVPASGPCLTITAQIQSVAPNQIVSANSSTTGDSQRQTIPAVGVNHSETIATPSPSSAPPPAPPAQAKPTVAPPPPSSVAKPATIVPATEPSSNVPQVIAQNSSAIAMQRQTVAVAADVKHSETIGTFNRGAMFVPPPFIFDPYGEPLLGQAIPAKSTITNQSATITKSTTGAKSVPAIVASTETSRRHRKHHESTSEARFQAPPEPQPPSQLPSQSRPESQAEAQRSSMQESQASGPIAVPILQQNQKIAIAETRKEQDPQAKTPWFLCC